MREFSLDCDNHMKIPNTKCGHPSFIDYGHRKTAHRGDIQRFKCKRCGATFIRKDVDFHCWYSLEVIAFTLCLFLEGIVLRDLADNFRIATSTVYRWALKFGALLHQYCSRFRPMHCKVLHCDELFLKMLKKFLYVWDSYAKESKWLTITPSWQRDKKSAEGLLIESPKPLDDTVTDGCFSYNEPIKKVIGRTNHIVAQDESKCLNNVIEGKQSNIRRFTRPRKGFKSSTNVLLFLKLYQHYHNFINNHCGDKKTTAEKLGYIFYPSGANKQDKIATLLRQAIKNWLKITNRKCEQFLY